MGRVEREDWENGILDNLENLDGQAIRPWFATSKPVEPTPAPPVTDRELGQGMAKMPEIDDGSWCLRLA